MAPSAKRQKLDTQAPEEENSESDQLSNSESEQSSSEEEEEEEIIPGKSKQTLKRRHRATAPSKFGSTLQYLIQTETSSTLPLSLKPSVAKQKNDEKLDIKAKRVLQIEKKEKEDKGRIRDVIGGWGGESERALRKVAQRGVVKLFNVIQQAQSAAVVEESSKTASRGTGKPSLPAPAPESIKGRGKNKDNVIGRGKDDKDDFFDMIRSGGVVSKV